MSKKRIHIDDLFRRGLGNMQLPVSGSDFADMQGMLAAAQKRRRRRIVVLWLVAGLLLLGGGITGGYMYYHNQPASEQELAEKVVPFNNGSAERAEQPDQPNTANQGTGESSAENNATTGGTGSHQEAAGNDGKEKGKTAEQPSVKEKGQPAKPGTGQQKPDAKKENTGNEITNGNDEENKPKQAEVVNQEEQPEKTAVVIQDSTAETTAEANPETPQDSAKEETSKKEAKTKQPSIPNPFSITISAGPLLNTFGINSATNYGRIRNQGDEPAGGLNAAITVDYQLSRWMFGTGLGVNSIGGRGHYQYSRTVWDSIPVLGPNGEIKGYLHTNYRDSAFNFSQEYRLNYVTVPVFASYNFPVGSKWGLKVGAGVQVQFLAALSGKYINPSNLFTFDLKNDGFIRRWNAAGNINLGFYYNINRYFTINTALTYSRFFNSMLSKTAGVGIHPRSAGLEIGLRYNFMKMAE